MTPRSRAVATAISAGQIVALKGLGGFHLLVDAADDAAVRRLRARKHRDEKPFALMYPDLGTLMAHAHLSDMDTRLLTSPEAPIVLVDARDQARLALAPAVAPGNRQLGVMLPYTPLHHVLLMRGLRRPVVATSGNLAEEPICTDEHDALRPARRHRRSVPGARPADRPPRRRLGRARGGGARAGAAPRPRLRAAVRSRCRPMPGRWSASARTSRTPWRWPWAGRSCVSQHIGDLETTRSSEAFHEVLGSLERLYHVSPVAVAVDMHPDYLSTQYGRRLGLPVTAVQHHYAHLAACMADNDLAGPVLGAVWDGSGYGPDGTVWGGEFLCTTPASFTRVACLRPFRLPGGERAVREPRRAAFGLLAACGGDLLERWLARQPEAFAAAERRVLAQAVAHGLNAPVTTSAGRLFDAVAALVGLRHVLAASRARRRWHSSRRSTRGTTRRTRSR